MRALGSSRAPKIDDGNSFIHVFTRPWPIGLNIVEQLVFNESETPSSF